MPVTFELPTELPGGKKTKSRKKNSGIVKEVELVRSNGGSKSPTVDDGKSASTPRRAWIIGG